MNSPPAPVLSSVPTTFGQKYVLPFSSVAACCFLLFGFPSAGWLPLLISAVASLWLVARSRQVQRVTFDPTSRCLIVSNFFRRYPVPVEHLAEVTSCRSPSPWSILLDFEPSTPLGRRVRVFPPLSPFDWGGHYENAVLFLVRLAAANSDRYRSNPALERTPTAGDAGSAGDAPRPQ